VAGAVALSIFSNKTTTPHPTLSPRGEGFTKIRTAKERITKDKTQKAIREWGQA
jgi:hypothetical protein